MSNPERGEVTITLDGRERTLRPTFQCLTEIERMTGKGILALAISLEGNDYRLIDVVAVIAAGLKASGERADAAGLGEAVLRSGAHDLTLPLSQFLVGTLTRGEAKNAEAPPSTPGG